MAKNQRAFQARSARRRASAELESHLELHIEDNMRSGMTSEEARRQALIKLGGLEQTKENYRDRRGLPWLDSLLQDIRFGQRMLRKNPGFTAVAVLTLALGIGANTTIFSALDGIFLDPLPYADSSRLVTIQRAQIAWGMYPEEIEEIRHECTAFDRVAAFSGSSGLILDNDLPLRRSIAHVGADFFPLLGVAPLLGRPILPQDVQPGNDRVAVLSYPLWKDSFGGDARILGRNIVIDDEPYTVIGVMPREFEFGAEGNYNDGLANDGLWVPLVAATPERSGRVNLTLVAHIRSGATLSEARAQVQTISARFINRFPPGNDYLDLVARNVQRSSTANLRDLRTALLVLLGAVGFVLVLACVNLSALMIARAWSRQREIAIREALGATRLRIVRQLLSESVLLALAGGALGLSFSLGGIRVLRAIAPPQTPRLDRVVLDTRVLLFTLAISFAAAVLFGLVPALQRTSRRPGGSLKGGLGGVFAGSETPERHWLRGALLIGEVALAVILVTGGALMVRSFEKLVHLDTGVRTDHVLTMDLFATPTSCEIAENQKAAKSKTSGSSNKSLSSPKSKSASSSSKEVTEPCPTAGDEILDAVRSLTGVQSAAFANGGAIVGGFNTFELAIKNGQGIQVINGVPLSAGNVTPGYFSTLGIRLLKGRDFSSTDTNAAIVSSSFATKYISGDPLGREFSTRWDTASVYPRQWVQIVGIVNDVRNHGLDNGSSGLASVYTVSRPSNIAELLVRTSADPMAVAPAIERIVHSMDGRATITQLETVDQLVADSAAQSRFQTVLLGSFSVLGLFLALVGIYGVLSYTVAGRTREIGIRMALGASPGRTLRSVIREGMIFTSIGIVMGVAAATGVTRVLQAFLFEIKPTDLVTFASVAFAVAAAALVACWIPARRAMRVDPVTAMRCE